MAWRIKCPPARPRIGESPGKRRLSIPGDTVSPGMEKAAAAPGAAAFGAGGLRPRPAKQKAEAGGKASGLSFSGRFAPCCRPP